TRTLGIIQWFPGQRESQIRGTSQFGTLFYQLSNLFGTPKIRLQAGILKNLSPESAVDRVPNRLKKGAEDRARNWVECAGRIHLDGEGRVFLLPRRSADAQKNEPTGEQAREDSCIHQSVYSAADCT